MDLFEYNKLNIKKSLVCNVFSLSLLAYLNRGDIFFSATKIYAKFLNVSQMKFVVKLNKLKLNLETSGDDNIN